MSIWTEGTEVSALNTLDTIIAEQVYFDSAGIEAIASLSLTGTPRVYTETAAIGSIAAVSAVEIGSAQGAITNPIAVAVGTGLVGTDSQGDVTLPLAVIAGEPTGTVVSPLPIVDGIALPGYSSIANLTFPSPTVIAQLDSGVLIIGSVQVPLVVVDVTSGSTAFIQSSIPVVDATGLTGRAGTGVVNNKLAQVTGVLSQETLTIGEVVLASPVALGEILQGTLNIGDVQNRPSTVAAVGLSGGIGAGAFTLPLLEVNAAFVTEVTGIGEVLLSLPDVRGNGLVILSTFATWVLNTKSNRVTNYTQFPFTALGLFGASPVGATADGLYLLTGDNDNGQSINSVFKFGMTDFRSELVNNADVYVGGDIESDMEVSIREDGQEDGNTYVLSERERHVRGHRAKLGKGFRSRYREISLSNVNGGNFDLDSLSLSSRDLRGNE